MGLFKRIFGRKIALCVCRERPAIKKLTLPNGLKINVCSECREEMEELIARPVNSTQFKAILSRVYVNKDFVWNIPWGATREEVIKNFPPEIATQLRSSKSDSLMSYLTAIEEVNVEIGFHFVENGLREVMISPQCFLVDVSRSLIESYGIPSDQFERPGISEESEPEHKAIWEKDGYDIEVDYTVYGFASISFICRERGSVHFD